MLPKQKSIDSCMLDVCLFCLVGKHPLLILHAGSRRSQHRSRSLAQECVHQARDDIRQSSAVSHGWLGLTEEYIPTRTVASTFRESLGASFFFKRGEGERRSATKLIPTIVRQMVTRIPELATTVQSAIQKDPEMTRKSLMEQFREVTNSTITRLGTTQS